MGAGQRVRPLRHSGSQPLDGTRSRRLSERVVEGEVVVHHLPKAEARFCMLADFAAVEGEGLRDEFGHPVDDAGVETGDAIFHDFLD